MESLFPTNPFQENIFTLLHEEVNHDIPLFTDGPEWERHKEFYSNEFVSPQSQSPQGLTPLKSYDAGIADGNESYRMYEDLPRFNDDRAPVENKCYNDIPKFSYTLHPDNESDVNSNDHVYLHRLTNDNQKQNNG